MLILIASAAVAVTVLVIAIRRRRDPVDRSWHRAVGRTYRHPRR